MTNNEFVHAWEVLQHAQDYLTYKTYNGDDGGICMTKLQWDIAICTAIGIIGSSLSAVALGQCCHESLESRLGACDGGERCRRQATHEINGSAFCERHGN